MHVLEHNACTRTQCMCLSSSIGYRIVPYEEGQGGRSKRVIVMQEALQIIVSVGSLQCQARALQAWQDFMALQARQAAQSDQAIEHRRFSKMATVFNTWSMCAAAFPL